MNATALPSPIKSTPTPERILQRLDWEVVRRLDGLLQGDYRTLLYGHGLDFADLREYQLEDDVRHIDWNVTARTNRLHVRQYVEDRELTAWFLLDLTPSMGYGTVERPKEAVLIDLVATLSRLLTRKGNQVAAIFYNGQIGRTIPPRGGRIQVLRLIRELLRETPAPGRATTDLSVLLDAGLNTFKRRSLVFLISDFISEPGWHRPLSVMNRRHELVGIRLWDPREVELPNAGLIAVEDVETGEQLYVDTGNPEFRRRFNAAAECREVALKNSLRQAGGDLYDISTEEDLVGAIVRMAALRKKRRR
jgi:uncharacterized protein (DUF58 family)